ncbi:unnamed protein product [Rotaria magnacalcarata]
MGGLPTTPPPGAQYPITPFLYTEGVLQVRNNNKQKRNDFLCGLQSWNCIEIDDINIRFTCFILTFLTIL